MSLAARSSPSTWLDVSYPTPHTVGHFRRTGSTENPLGQRVPTFAAVEPREVIGHRTKSTTENQSSTLGGRVTTEKYLLTAEDDWAPGDRVVIAGETFDVIGDPEDARHGPWQFETGLIPGFRLTLRKVTDGAH